ncbi:LysM peptidoglycan-binding domain-containing protein [Rossellomorea sp. AcN35-11]|nr:LysM peptidoglycan-binding domain-containing protein [Rossellomorea aquimaris]WJV30749.1 LysM peptidoglycan-binding domain-containing protein [Rossellomorea sp. AcN35-11]
MKKTLTTVAATAVLSSSFVSYAAASTHKVEAGDSLWTIAREYDTTVSNLKSWNKLQSELIYPNQLLKVAQSGSTSPTSPPKKAESNKNEGKKTYTVKSGDTLGQIALAHSVSVSDLSSWNGIKNHLIYPGQVLKVSKAATSSPAPAKPEPAQPKVNQTTYTVKSGDTLGRIALAHSVSVSELTSWNGLKGHLIYPGQVLKVSKGNGQAPAPAAPSPAKPKPATGQQSYTVQSGDTLSHISMKFDVSVAELKSWNGLKNDFLQVGQVLQVKAGKKPVASPPKQDKPETPASFSIDKLLSEATSHMGTPYVWGGSLPGGFDCSGFIYYVFKEAGADSIKRLNSEGYYSRSYYVNTPQPGDLVFFENTYKKGISHLGIYLGNNEFIHAGDHGVQITSLDNSYWKSKFDGFKRFYEL